MTYEAKLALAKRLLLDAEQAAGNYQNYPSANYPTSVSIKNEEALFFASLLEAHLHPAPDVAKDVAFLAEMHEYSQSILTDRWDITKVQHLDKMIEDWRHELEIKLIAGPDMERRGRRKH